MMLTEFQARYPTGSLISELLTIYQGKFVVRVVVQIDGVTRTTGMAAAETVEVAEDKARSRAIAMMAADRSPSPLPAVGAIAQPPLPKTFSPEPAEQNLMPNQPLTATEPLLELDYKSIAPSPPIEPKPALASTSGVKSKSKRSPIASSELAPEDEVFGEFGIAPDAHTQSSSEPAIAFSSNIKPIKSPSERAESMVVSEIPTPISEPIDLSEDLAAIDVKLKELSWSPEQESEYLERTYGKSSRQQLATAQVQEFRRYLELFSQTTKELKELKWSNQRGRDYLGQKYNKKSRQHLSIDELQEFLEYLQSERDRLS